MNTLQKRLTLVTGAAVIAGTLAACGPHCYSHDDSGEHAEWIVERVSRELDLDETQKDKLNAVRSTLLAAREEAAARHKDSKKEFLALLSQATLDRDRAVALVHIHTSAIEAKAPVIIAAAGDFYDSLTPAQQAELRTHLEKRINAHGH